MTTEETGAPCGFEKRTQGGRLLRCVRPAEECNDRHVFRFVHDDQED